MSFQSKAFSIEGLDIHESHEMEFKPCMFLECGKCFLSVERNLPELALECSEDIHDINNSRVVRENYKAPNEKKKSDTNVVS